MRAWWKRVGEPILSEHYTARQREKDSGTADLLNEVWGENVLVRQHSETGESIDDVATFVRRVGATSVIQRYGRRQHVLQIVRWLTYLIFALGATHRIELLFGVEEPFKLFLNDDRCFRRRKTWEIYPPFFRRFGKRFEAMP